MFYLFFLIVTLSEIVKMKKIQLILASLFFSVILLSFSVENSSNQVRSYGISENDPSQIRLDLNPDNSFYFRYFSNLSEQIELKGTWTLKGKKLILEAADGTKKFHSVWRTVSAGQKIK